MYITLSNHNNKVLINSNMHFCTSECSFICRSIKFWQYTVLQVHSFDSASELQRTDQNSHWFSDLTNWKFLQSQNLRKSMLKIAFRKWYLTKRKRLNADLRGSLSVSFKLLLLHGGLKKKIAKRWGKNYGIFISMLNVNQIGM